MPLQRRSGWRERAHQKLPRFSDRNFRRGARGARLQAQKSDAELLIPVEVESLDCARSGPERSLLLHGGRLQLSRPGVFLSQHASKVHMLVRGPSLAVSMSRYLIDRIEATSNIELKPQTEITQLHGDAPGALAAVTWRDRGKQVEGEKALRNVFLFVGADPETRWLAGCHAAVDAPGFVLTGAAAGVSAEVCRGLRSGQWHRVAQALHQ